MKSIFELKTELPFDADSFERMKITASDLLQNAEKGKYTQAIVLLASTGKEYGARIANALSEERVDEKALLEGLKSKNDTQIHRILCMWADGGIDLPSMGFRKTLCTVNAKNTEAGIFVMTPNGISELPLGVTVK